jgi:hypothetical protein
MPNAGSLRRLCRALLPLLLQLPHRRLHPDELLTQAASLGYTALAITDECSLAGMVRAYAAWQQQQGAIQLIVGTHLQLADGPWLVLLATDRSSYGRLSSLITRGRRAAEKGSYHLTRADLDAGLPGCLALLLPPGDVACNPQQLADDADWLARRFPAPPGWPPCSCSAPTTPPAAGTSPRPPPVPASRWSPPARR